MERKGRKVGCAYSKRITYMEDKILKFTGIIENEATTLSFGTLTVNVVLVNGSPELKTLNIVLNRRFKYPIRNELDISTPPLSLTK